MTPSQVLANVPLGGRIDRDNGGKYDYAIIDSDAGIIQLASDGELKQISFDDAPDDFKRGLIREAGEKVHVAWIKEILGHAIKPDERLRYLQAWRLLHTKDNAFFKFCVQLVSDFHALDTELIQTLLFGMTRARISSAAALVHFDCTGSSGAGKNDLVNRVLALVPSRCLDLFSSASPTALYYETLEWVDEGRGKQRRVVNETRFRGKIVCITEVADAAGFSALKALAETDESAEQTHIATVKGESIKMTIRGPRCVIVTSVDGINDSQVKRRFIHTSVSPDTPANKQLKLAIAQQIMMDELDMRDDPRTAVARAGIDLMFSTEGVVFEDIEPEAKQLVTALNQAFTGAGYGITNVKQFYTLCLCSALWNRFYRGYTRVEIADVCAAWFLLSKFEKETVTRTTLTGIEVLRTIKQLSDEYDAKYEEDSSKYDTGKPKRPTRTEIAKASNIPQATVYRLLRTKEDASGKLGELLELGYVLNEYRDGQVVVELSDLGHAVLGEAPRSITLDGRHYTPIEPRAIGDPDIKDIATLDAIIERYFGQETEKESLKTFYHDSQGVII
jgi:hypothetical protein